MWFIVLLTSLLCSVLAEELINPKHILYEYGPTAFNAHITFDQFTTKDILGYQIIVEDTIDNTKEVTTYDKLFSKDIKVSQDVQTYHNYAFYIILVKENGVLCNKKLMFTVMFAMSLSADEREYYNQCLYANNCVIKLKLDWEYQCQEASTFKKCQSLVVMVAVGVAAFTVTISCSCACTYALVCSARRKRRARSAPPETTPTDEEHTYDSPSVVYAELVQAPGRDRGVWDVRRNRNEESPYARIAGFLTDIK